MLTIDIPYFSTATNTFECSYDTQLTDNDVRSTLTYISNGYCGTLPGYCDIINYIPIPFGDISITLPMHQSNCVQTIISKEDIAIQNYLITQFDQIFEIDWYGIHYIGRNEYFNGLINDKFNITIITDSVNNSLLTLVFGQGFTVSLNDVLNTVLPPKKSLLEFFWRKYIPRLIRSSTDEIWNQRINEFYFKIKRTYFEEY